MKGCPFPCAPGLSSRVQQSVPPGCFREKVTCFLKKMRNTPGTIRTTRCGGGVLTAAPRRLRPGTWFESGRIGAGQVITAVGRGRGTTHRSLRRPHTAAWRIPQRPGPWGTRLNRVCENILAWMCHPDPRRGRPPCLPISLKAIGCWARRTRATTGGCPYGCACPCPTPMGIARKSAQTHGARISERATAGQGGSPRRPSKATWVMGR